MTQITESMKTKVELFLIRITWNLRFTWLADSGAAEDDHLDPVYVCHQLRELSIIRAGITNRLCDGCANYVTLHFNRQVFSSGHLTYSYVHIRIRTRAKKGPMSFFLSTRDNCEHTHEINYKVNCADRSARQLDSSPFNFAFNVITTNYVNITN